jgi:hypothetical protein
MMFQKAVKHDLKLRLMISGPSGYGKTYSALAMATALGGPVAVIDTEHGKSALYSDTFAFDVAEMHEPFEPEKYIKALKAAQAAGYRVLVIDSLSHAWAGPGGVLDYVDQVAKRSKSANTYTAWKEGTPIQNALVEAILQSDLHVIATARAKTEYILETNDRGRQQPRKVGMKPIQRDDLEYEFDVWFEMLDTDNNAAVQKTRCSALQGAVINKPGVQVVEVLNSWLRGGAPSAPPAQAPVAEKADSQPSRPAPTPVQKPPVPAPAQPAQPTAQAAVKPAPAEAPRDVKALVGRLVERAATQFVGTDGGYLGDETVLMFLANRDLVERSDERITSLADLVVLGAQQVIACGKAIAAATAEDIAAAWEDAAAEAVEL